MTLNFVDIFVVLLVFFVFVKMYRRLLRGKYSNRR
jgi:hypothetical protein